MPFRTSLLFVLPVGDENRSPSRSKKIRKRTSVILPAEVPLPTPGVEYTPLSDEQSKQLSTSLTQSFYRHVSRYVLLSLLMTTHLADYFVKLSFFYQTVVEFGTSLKRGQPTKPNIGLHFSLLDFQVIVVTFKAMSGEFLTSLRSTL